MTDADANVLESKAEQVLRRIHQPGQVAWVQTAPAAPVPAFIETLRKMQRNVVVVEPPPIGDADAALHALLQASASLGREAIETTLEQADLLLSAEQLGQQLATNDAILVLRLPASWESSGEKDNPERELFYGRAEDVLFGFRRAASLRIVFISSPALDPAHQRRLVGSGSARVHLSATLPSEGALDDLQRWGARAPSAQLVRDALKGHTAKLSQAQLALLLLLTALGDDVQAALAEFDASAGEHALGPLVQRLEGRLSGPHASALRSGLVRLARARFPLARKDAIEITALPLEDASFLVDTVGGDSGQVVRVDDSVRAMLAPWMLDRDPETHERLARKYEARDGKADITDTDAHTIIPWLEKTHNDARTGELGRDRWHENEQKQRLRAPEFYWDRARSLSIEFKDYVGAAEVYRRCAGRFAYDDYAWHYYAWNLDRAGRRPLEVEKGYRKAVELKDKNRWWNSRLVTFLIEQGRFQDAEQEWRLALERLDPKRVLVHQDRRLARHVHRWVVEEWLEAGEVSRARKVFNQIPRDRVQMSRALLELEWRLRDAEEAMELGHSVYPAGLRIEERWKKPATVLDKLPDGTPLLGWYPGAVMTADSDQVVLVFATPEEDPDERRLIRTELSADEWRKMADWCAPEQARGFVVLASYGDEEAKVERLFQQRAPSAPWEEKPRPVDDRTRYLRAWVTPGIGHDG